MVRNPGKHHRQSIRLKDYNYSRAGAYFITIVTQGRVCLFGDVVDGAMRLNEAGQMIQSVWDDIPAFYPGVDTDEFVVMPNHVHGIVVLVGATPRGRPDGRGRPDATGQAQGPAPTFTLTLGDVVHRFKTMTTKAVCKRGQTILLARILWAIVATQLLRTHRPRRRISEPHPPVHRR